MVECTCFGRKKNIGEVWPSFRASCLSNKCKYKKISLMLLSKDINFFMKFICRLEKKRYNVPRYNLKMRNNKGKKCPPSLCHELKVFINTQKRNNHAFKWQELVQNLIWHFLLYEFNCMQPKFTIYHTLWRSTSQRWSKQNIDSQDIESRDDYKFQNIESK